MTTRLGSENNLKNLAPSNDPINLSDDPKDYFIFYQVSEDYKDYVTGSIELVVYLRKIIKTFYQEDELLPYNLNKTLDLFEKIFPYF